MNPTDWLNEVWRSDLPSNSKLLAAYLRWYLHSNSQTCWPSKATIQRDTGLAKRTIQKHLVNLDQEGWITIIKSNGGHSNRYKITPVLNDNGVTTTPQRVQNDTPNRCKIAPQRNKEKTNKNNIYKFDAMDRLIDRAWAGDLIDDD